MNLYALAAITTAVQLGACVNRLPLSEAPVSSTLTERLQAHGGFSKAMAAPGWIGVWVIGKNEGPEGNPDHVPGAATRFDLDGDGRTEVIQQRHGGAAYSDFRVYSSDDADPRVLLSGSGGPLLFSTGPSVNGWPVLGLDSRDYDAGTSVEARIIQSYSWNGEQYVAAAVYRRPR